MKDSIGIGAGIGCAAQLLFLVLLWAFLWISKQRVSPIVLSSWGLTQWLVLAPLIVQQRREGHTRTVQGMFIVGGIGLLLSSACAYAFHNF